MPFSPALPSPSQRSCHDQDPSFDVLVQRPADLRQRRAGARLARQAREPDGAVPGGRPIGCHCAHLLQPPGQGAGAAGAGGEPGRRQRRHGRTEGADGPCRRVLPVPGFAQRGDPVAAGQCRGEAEDGGLPPRAPGGRCGDGVRDAQGPAGFERRRADRPGEGQPGRVELRLGRRRLHQRVGQRCTAPDQ